MKSLISAVAILVAAIAGNAFASDYWPTSGTTTYTYVSDGGYEWVVSMVDGQRDLTYASGWFRQTFSADAYGNVFLSSWTALNTSYDIRIPYGEDYAPPLLFPTSSLAVGQTNVSPTYATNPYGFTHLVWCRWEVVAEETVAVPAGVFDTMVVEVSCESDGLPSGRYYLSREVGPVILPRGYRLASVNGTVPTEDTTWGSLKALFR